MFKAANAVHEAQTKAYQHTTQEIETEKCLQSLKTAMEMQAEGDIQTALSVYEELLKNPVTRVELKEIPNIQVSTPHVLIYTLHKTYGQLLSSLPNSDAYTISKHYEKALRVDPTSAALWLQLSKLYLETKRIRNARWALERCLAASREHTGTYTQLGIDCLKLLCDVYYHLGDDALLNRASKEITKLDPKWTQGVYYRYHCLKTAMEHHKEDLFEWISQDDYIDYIKNHKSWEKVLCDKDNGKVMKKYVKDRMLDHVPKKRIKSRIVRVPVVTWKNLMLKIHHVASRVTSNGPVSVVLGGDLAAMVDEEESIPDDVFEGDGPEEEEEEEEDSMDDASGDVVETTDEQTNDDTMDVDDEERERKRLKVSEKQKENDDENKDNEGENGDQALDKDLFATPQKLQIPSTANVATPTPTDTKPDLQSPSRASPTSVLADFKEETRRTSRRKREQELIIDVEQFLETDLDGNIREVIPAGLLDIFDRSVETVDLVKWEKEVKGEKDHEEAKQEQDKELTTPKKRTLSAVAEDGKTPIKMEKFTSPIKSPSKSTPNPKGELTKEDSLFNYDTATTDRERTQVEEFVASSSCQTISEWCLSLAIHAITRIRARKWIIDNDKSKLAFMLLPFCGGEKVITTHLSLQYPKEVVSEILMMMAEYYLDQQRSEVAKKLAMKPLVPSDSSPSNSVAAITNNSNNDSDEEDDLPPSLSIEFITYWHALCLHLLQHPLKEGSPQWIQYELLAGRKLELQGHVQQAIKHYNHVESVVLSSSGITVPGLRPYAYEDIKLEKRRLQSKKFLDECDGLFESGDFASYVKLMSSAILVDMEGKPLKELLELVPIVDTNISDMSASISGGTGESMVEVLTREYLWHPRQLKYRWETQQKFLKATEKYLDQFDKALFTVKDATNPRVRLPTVNEADSITVQRLERVRWIASIRTLIDYMKNHFTGLRVDMETKMEQIAYIAKIVGEPFHTKHYLYKWFAHPHDRIGISSQQTNETNLTKEQQLKAQHPLNTILEHTKLPVPFYESVMAILRLVWTVMINFTPFMEHGASAAPRENVAACVDERRHLAGQFIIYSWILLVECCKYFVMDPSDPSAEILGDVTASGTVIDPIASLLSWVHEQMAWKCYHESHGICTNEHGIFHHYTLRYLQNLPLNLQDPYHIEQIYWCLYGLDVTLEGPARAEDHLVKPLPFDKEAAISVYKMIRRPALAKLHQPTVTRFGSGEKSLKELLTKIGEAAVGKIPLHNTRVALTKQKVDYYLNTEGKGLLLAELKGKTQHLQGLFPLLNADDHKDISDVQFSYFYMMGRLSYMASFIKNIANKVELLEQAVESFLNHIYLQPREFEGWLWLAHSYMYLAFEYSNTSRLEWTSHREEIAEYQFKAFKCFLQTKALITRKHYPWFDERSVGAVFWGPFGHLIYHILCKPNNGYMLEKYLGRTFVARPLDGSEKNDIDGSTNIAVERKAKSQSWGRSLLELGAKCFARACSLDKSNWLCFMMKGRMQQKLNRPIEEVLHSYRRAFTIAQAHWSVEKDRNEQTKYFGPAAKLIGFLIRSLLNKRIPPTVVFEIFDKDYVKDQDGNGNVEFSEGEYLRAYEILNKQLTWFRNVDSSAYHHRFCYHQSWLHWRCLGDPKQAQAEMQGPKGIFAEGRHRQRLMRVWNADCQAPSRWIHYTQKYIIYYLDLLIANNDLETMITVASKLSPSTASAAFMNFEEIEDKLVVATFESARARIETLHNRALGSPIEMLVNTFSATDFNREFNVLEAKLRADEQSRPKELSTIARLVEFRSTKLGGEHEDEVDDLIVEFVCAVLLKLLNVTTNATFPDMNASMLDNFDAMDLDAPPVNRAPVASSEQARAMDPLKRERILQIAEALSKALPKQRKQKHGASEAAPSGEGKHDKAEYKANNTHLSRAERLARRMKGSTSNEAKADDELSEMKGNAEDSGWFKHLAE